MTIDNMFEFFKIQLLEFEDSKDIFDISKGTSIRCICNMQRHGCFNPLLIEADPFLFVHRNRLFLFYEEKMLNDPGVIKMTSTYDLKKWSKPLVVLREDYHLSFPWVFEENGNIYMLPETGAAGGIRLYEATDDTLSNFRFCKTLLQEPTDCMINMHYGDSCIMKKEETYYLFTQLQYEDKINTLELFTSPSLLGPYTKHPASPIQHSQKVGRNAGSLLTLDGHIYRFSQDCTVMYGDNVHVSEVDVITPTDYQEHIIKENVIPTSQSFYRWGGHQFNAVQFQGKWIVATDAKEYHPLWGIRIRGKFRRVMHKLISK